VERIYGKRYSERKIMEGSVMPTIKLKAFTLLERVRTQSPVVHHLTNWVTIYDCAQVARSPGGN
jgi:hypothetical protein